ncbi:hypothetical protein [Microbacterium candidum]|uniref:Secreted protein n=1 Tax=Microbacterium candidum TaxID=3041922 RepID=A0ABT7MU73_9MICO|nr:hypothetical protein [Microbacterium sp. ASV49]MDL9977983.1 hypothetical protein [Microbacterium sp. ASV49]
MKISRWAALPVVLALGSVIAVAGPASAASPNGQTVTSTQNVHGVFWEKQATNPCTGDTFNGGKGIQFTGNLVNHITFFTNSDEVWMTFTETGAILGIDDGNGVTYSGHATAWGNFNMNERNANNAFTLTIKATGSDGSTVFAHDTAVWVMNADGTVTVNFDKFNMTCG